MVESAQANEPVAAEAPSAEEISQMIEALEQYRDRLIEDFTTTAKKAKLPKSMTMAQLKTHPEIVKIETSLAQLRGEAPGKTPGESDEASTEEA